MQESDEVPRDNKSGVYRMKRFQGTGVNLAEKDERPESFFDLNHESHKLSVMAYWHIVEELKETEAPDIREGNFKLRTEEKEEYTLKGGTGYTDVDNYYVAFRDTGSEEENPIQVYPRNIDPYCWNCFRDPLDLGRRFDREVMGKYPLEGTVVAKQVGKEDIFGYVPYPPDGYEQALEVLKTQLAHHTGFVNASFHTTEPLLCSCGKWRTWNENTHEFFCQFHRG